MSSQTVVKVIVEDLTKFGYKANGRFVNYSKKLSDADKARVVPGAQFEAEYFIADSGKEYLNKILATGVAQAPSSQPVVASVAKPETKVDGERAKHFTPKYQKKEDSGLSKDEWAAKDRRISRQGCIQAAVNALGPVMSADDLFKAAKALADQMLDYVNEVK